MHFTKTLLYTTANIYRSTKQTNLVRICVCTCIYVELYYSGSLLALVLLRLTALGVASGDSSDAGNGCGTAAPADDCDTDPGAALGVAGCCSSTADDADADAAAPVFTTSWVDLAAAVEVPGFDLTGARGAGLSVGGGGAALCVGGAGAGLSEGGGGAGLVALSVEEELDVLRLGSDESGLPPSCAPGVAISVSGR